MTCHKDIEIVWTAENGRKALELLKKETVDVLLLDLDMPDMDGLEVTRQAVPLYPDMKILILTMHDDEMYAERVMKAGACGYLLKGSCSGELSDIIRKVAAGKIHVHPSIVEKTAAKHYSREIQGTGLIESLSERELQIMKMITEGKAQNEIATELNISTSTVATHKRRLMEKLNLKKNADLIRFALKADAKDLQ